MIFLSYFWPFQRWNIFILISWLIYVCVLSLQAISLPFPNLWLSHAPCRQSISIDNPSDQLSKHTQVYSR